jgi:hypothetical protein
MGLIPGDVSGLDEMAGRTQAYNGRQFDIRKRRRRRKKKKKFGWGRERRG